MSLRQSKGSINSTTNVFFKSDPKEPMAYNEKNCAFLHNSYSHSAALKSWENLMNQSYHIDKVMHRESA